MTKRYLGNIITQNPTAPSDNFEDTPAPGVWSLAEAFAYSKAGLWPTAGNVLSRGLFFGGSSRLTTIDYIDLTTAGNAIDFGDLIGWVQGAYNRGDMLAAFASGTRAVAAGGGSNLLNKIGYVTIATTGDTTDFGDLQPGTARCSGLSSTTRGLVCAGRTTSGVVNTIQYVTIASTGNASDFGDVTQARTFPASCASTTRGVISGGQNGSSVGYNTIDYVTIANTGNAIDFGNLSGARFYHSSASNSTRGLMAGGYQSGAVVNIIEYVTIANTGNTTDFGDLTATRYKPYAASSQTRAVVASGNSGDASMDFVTIATTGNGADYGDLTAAGQSGAGASNTHGGIAA